MLPGKVVTPAVIVEMITRRIWLVVIPPILTLLVALMYSSTIKNVYEAETVVAVDPQRVPDAFVRSTVTLSTERRLEALKVQLLSRGSLEQLVESHNLYPEERQSQPIEGIIARVREDINITAQIPRPQWGELPQPTAIRIKFRYHLAEEAAKVARDLGAMIVEKNQQQRSAQASSTNEFLGVQLEEARAQLEKQERRLEVFRQQHGQELPTQMQTNLQALGNAQIQVQSIVESLARDRDRKLVLDRLYREALRAQSVPPAATAAPTVNDRNAANVPQTARQQLASAKANLETLLLRYTPDHPDIVRARRQVAELEPKAAEESKAATQALAATQSDPAQPDSASEPVQPEAIRQMRAELESIDRQIEFKTSEERRVRTEIAEYQRRLEAVPGLESQWSSLTRDYDTLQTAYRELLNKRTAAQLAENLEDEAVSERFRIIENASVPSAPLMSMRVRYNGAGFMLGLMLGLGLALALEIRDKSFRTDVDVLDLLALPVLASVPYVATSAEKTRQQRQRIAAIAAGFAAVSVAGYIVWTMKLWKSLV